MFKFLKVRFKVIIIPDLCVKLVVGGQRGPCHRLADTFPALGLRAAVTTKAEHHQVRSEWKRALSVKCNISPSYYNFY